MNKAKAMLDALMGPSRDVAKKDKKNDEFKERNCCKHYLVGCCPNAMLGKKMEAIRKDPATFCICPGVQFDRPSCLNPEGCTKLHSLGLRTQLAEHPKADTYRRDYEEDLRKFLVDIIDEAEKKTSHEKRKREELGREVETEKMCDVCGMRYKLKKKEYGIEADDFHDESDVHKAYVKLRKRLAELEEKAKVEEEKKAEETKKKEEDDKKQLEEDAAKEKDGEKDGKTDGKTDGKKDGKKSRSRSGARGKSREGEGDDRKKSRRPSNDRKNDDRRRSRSARREKDHGHRDSGRGRDRDRGGRAGGRGSPSRDRDSGRGRHGGSDRDRGRGGDRGREDRSDRRRRD